MKSCFSHRNKSGSLVAMKQYISPILSNTALCTSMYQLEFQLEGMSEPPLPGQFFTVRIAESLVPLLRRPFAFSRFEKERNCASCIYQVRGKGTELLSALGNPATLDIIASLGKPFPLPQRHQAALLIAGGIGLGPILFLANVLQRRESAYRLIFGCRSEEFIPSAIFQDQPAVFCTDDGSRGFHGTVVDYLATIVPSITPDTVLYCCGPRAMLRGCHTFSCDHQLRCFVSVEQVMACGVGACMGCAVKVRGEPSYVRACKDGPVFDSRDILWE